MNPLAGLLGPWYPVARVLIVVAALGALWGHGYLTATKRARAEASAETAARLADVNAHNAEVAGTLGELVREARAREAEALSTAQRTERAAIRREEAWRRERDSNPDCDAWLRAPVPCRLRAEAADR